MYEKRSVIGEESRRWKTVTLRTLNNEEEIVVPVMQASNSATALYKKPVGVRTGRLY